MSSWASLTNTKNNIEILNGASAQHVLSVIDNKIYAIDPRNYDGQIPNKHLRDTELFDISINGRIESLTADGKIDEAEKLDPTLSLGYDLAADADRQMKRMDRDNNGRLIKPVGAAGNIIDTPYEVARQLKYLSKVSGKEYKLKIFQARNTVNIISSGSDLHLTGFIKIGELLKGSPKLSDYQEPDPSRQAFDRYEKAIYADSFHWQSTIRERSNSGPNIESEMAKELPGIMEEMVDAEIRSKWDTLSINATLGNWKSTASNGHFDENSDEDVQDGATLIDEFSGQFIMYCHRKVVSAYLKNIKGRNYDGVKSILPENERSGVVPLNEDLTYYVGNQLAEDEFIIAAREHAVEMHQGPQLDIMYKNERTPGQLIGRMKFNYNGVIVKFPEAATKFDGVVV